MGKKYLITFIVGTRPEAIKLAPVILKFKEDNNFKVKIISTGQHNDLINSIFEIFDLEFDINLNILKSGQSLASITSKALNGLDEEFKIDKPDMVIVQGDTTSSMVGALAAFYHKLEVAHIEAGLRTDDRFNPFPEEINRRIITQLSKFHFAPTLKSKENLLNSNVMGDVFVTGNTVIDALFYALKKNKNSVKDEFKLNGYKLILTTVHRRENWGENLEDIAYGLKDILEEFNKVKIVIPLHPNVLVRDKLYEILGKNDRALLIEPLPYNKFIDVMNLAKFVITDSGGLQEEAPSLGKPVLIIRETTERPEAIEAGTAKLIGSKRNKIFNESKRLLQDDEYYMSMSKAINPFGDGKSSERIFEIIKNMIY